MESQRHSLTMFVWVTLKENVRSASILWIISEDCSNQGFLPCLQENCQSKSHRETCCRNDIFMVLRHASFKEKRGKIANLRIKRLGKYLKSRRHAWIIINSKKKVSQLENCPQFAHEFSQIVMKCLYVARIGRLDILWSVNKFARPITKWTKACDKRLSRWISYIHHTCEFKQYCHVGNTAKQCRLG